MELWLQSFNARTSSPQWNLLLRRDPPLRPAEANQPAQGVSTVSTTTTSQAEHHAGANSSRISTTCYPIRTIACVHSRAVGAPLTVVWDELHRVPMSALPLGIALKGVRLLPARPPAGSVNPWPARLSGRHPHSGAVPPSDPGRDLSRPQPGLAATGRSDTAPAGRGGAASLVPTWMDQGRMEFASKPPRWARCCAPRPACSRRTRGHGGPSQPTGSSSVRAVAQFVARC